MILSREHTTGWKEFGPEIGTGKALYCEWNAEMLLLLLVDNDKTADYTKAWGKEAEAMGKTWL